MIDMKAHISRRLPWLIVLGIAACGSDAGEAVVGDAEDLGAGCAPCIVDATLMAMIGDLEGPGIVQENASLYVVPEGKVLLKDLRSIQIFDTTGTFEGVLGGRGEGPGEFVLPAGISVATDGTVSVFDVGTRRITSYDGDLSLIELQRLPDYRLDLGPNAIVPVGGEEYVVATRLRDPELRNYPLHVVTAGEPEFGLSFGNAPGDTATWQVRRVITAAGTGEVWTAPLGRYVLERWNANGERTAAIERDVPWFPTQVAPRELIREVMPEPQIVDLQEGGDGRLWVLISVASEGWTPLPADAVSLSGETRTSPEQFETLLDSVVEVLDPVTGELVASGRFPERLLGFAGPGLAYRYAPHDLNPRYELYRLDMGP